MCGDRTSTETRGDMRQYRKWKAASSLGSQVLDAMHNKAQRLGIIVKLRDEPHLLGDLREVDGVAEQLLLTHVRALTHDRDSLQLIVYVVCAAIALAVALQPLLFVH